MPALLPACTADEAPLIVISNLQIFAPIPGSTAGVAYFEIENHSGEKITITGADSPQFAHVQMHTTTNVDGVSRMRQIESFDIAANARDAFVPGGKHLMLINLATDVTENSPVTLELRFGDKTLLIIAPLRNRLPSN